MSAPLILMLAEGEPGKHPRPWAAVRLTSLAGVRFTRQRLAGLFARHRGRRVEKRTPKLEAKIDWTRRSPTDGSTH